MVLGEFFVQLGVWARSSTLVNCLNSSLACFGGGGLRFSKNLWTPQIIPAEACKKIGEHSLGSRFARTHGVKEKEIKGT